jgi:hypothetical protein
MVATAAGVPTLGRISDESAIVLRNVLAAFAFFDD